MSCCGDSRCENNWRVRPLRPLPSLEEIKEMQKRFALEEPDECRKNIVKKYVWTTTYREMNKDGAALPIAIRDTECVSSEERPPGDPMKRPPEMAPKSMMHIGDVFEKWDRPQVRKMAMRCDTMYNRPWLGHDAYFQEQHLCRAKYARCPEGHDVPTKENLELVRNNMLRQPYDIMLPGYGGYESVVAPPVCKVKKVLVPNDPYEVMTMYQETYTKHPQEVYDHPTKALRPSDLAKIGIASNPINTLWKLPLECAQAQRLSGYLECEAEECPRGDIPLQPCNE